MRIFVDMDGVIVDFDKLKRELRVTGDELKKIPGAYLGMQPIPEAIEAVRAMIKMGHDVWLATRPPTGLPYAYSDKVAWVLKWLPELKEKIILTHDKSLLIGDLLIDDRPHKANATHFIGHLHVFRNDWPEILLGLRRKKFSPRLV